jgi:diacylglycerol kinase (ATP)
VTTPRHPPCVLLNPHAQGGRAVRLWPALQQALSALDPQATLHQPDTPDEAARLMARLPARTRLVAVGGDGTLHRWLPALQAAGLELAVLPLGSGNDTARALGLQPLRADAAPDAVSAELAVALRGHASPIDLGRVDWTDAAGQPHHRPFLSSLTVGFDSAVVRRTLGGPRWLRGLPRYLWATLGELARLRNWTVTVTRDGEALHHGPVLMASTLNTPTYGSGMPAAPEARIDDGRLDLLLAGPFGRPGALFMLPRLLTGTHGSHPQVQLQPCRRLCIDSPHDLPLAADGEWLGPARRITVTVLPGALRAVRRDVVRPAPGGPDRSAG